MFQIVLFSVSIKTEFLEERKKILKNNNNEKPNKTKILKLKLDLGLFPWIIQEITQNLFFYMYDFQCCVCVYVCVCEPFGGEGETGSVISSHSTVGSRRSQRHLFTRTDIQSLDQREDGSASWVTGDWWWRCGDCPQDSWTKTKADSSGCSRQLDPTTLTQCSLV